MVRPTAKKVGKALDSCQLCRFIFNKKLRAYIVTVTQFFTLILCLRVSSQAETKICRGIRCISHYFGKNYVERDFHVLGRCIHIRGRSVTGLQLDLQDHTRPFDLAGVLQILSSKL